MVAGRDDDALRWDGDDDPTLDVGTDPTEPTEPGDHAGPADAGRIATTASTGETATLPEGWNAVGRGSDAITADSDREAGARSDSAGTTVRESMGNAELISLGVLGGFSLLYAVGWLIGGLRLQAVAEFLVAPVAYQVSLWLAVLAPLVWFTTVCLLTAGSRSWVRFAWLAAGVVLLLPWPFIMVGVIGR